MSNWKKKTLKEVVKLWVRGSTPRRNNKDYYCGKEEFLLYVQGICEGEN